MLALFALVCFVVALFTRHLGPIDPAILGLVFVAAHLLWPITAPFSGRRAAA